MRTVAIFSAQTSDSTGYKARDERLSARCLLFRQP